MVVVSWYDHQRFTQGPAENLVIRDGSFETTIVLEDARGIDESNDSYTERCWLMLVKLSERVDELETKLMDQETRNATQLTWNMTLEAQLDELRKGMEEIGVIKSTEPEDTQG